MSFIKMLNKIGPSIEPWGTPLRVSDQLLRVPFNLTCCVRPVR